ncbi:hypothetical protein Pcinc_032060 [Petrolisthes cinctipes]|uniref:Ribosomal protein L15 n=1 Tax=Petrolisthes cinctipes TaxID=88211 RepID=A0AAE1K1M6_PETCI|nr:hypothetical protein Pcinc_032060 [Petrolisthes cinctipes]
MTQFLHRHTHMKPRDKTECIHPRPTPYNAYTEHPRLTQPEKAPRLGYKAKQGLVIYDIHVRLSGRKHPVTKIVVVPQGVWPSSPQLLRKAMKVSGPAAPSSSQGCCCSSRCLAQQPPAPEEGHEGVWSSSPQLLTGLLLFLKVSDPAAPSSSQGWQQSG